MRLAPRSLRRSPWRAAVYGPVAVLLVAAMAIAQPPATQPAETRPAETQPASSPRKAVGEVLGRTVYADQIGLTAPIDPAVEFDASDAELWQQMSRIVTVMGGPIVERFVVEREIEPTQEELEAFERFQRGVTRKLVRDAEQAVPELEAKLRDESLSPEAREQIEQRLEAERFYLEAQRQPADDADRERRNELASAFIVSWKVQRELHRKYGGRIIFQQAGPEALDGMRRLYEEAEKAGDLKFFDPGVRHLFYYYFNMPHSEIDDPEALERPWFLRPTTQPSE